jgi:hypothetical protein
MPGFMSLGVQPQYMEPTEEERRAANAILNPTCTCGHVRTYHSPVNFECDHRQPTTADMLFGPCGKRCECRRFEKPAPFVAAVAELSGRAKIDREGEV